MPVQITNWEELRLALGKELQPEGRFGFEGLLARMFEAEFRFPCYLARTGDQPAGDVYGPSVGVALQAKRYLTGRIDGNNVEGDIDRALREAPGTDVFVVASTRADSQLKLRLEKKTEETGVDIVLLALDDAASPLGALCLTHWTAVQGFFPEISAASNTWAEVERRKVAVARSLALLRAEVSGLPTRMAVGDLARKKLHGRVHGGVIGSHAHNRVNIADGVPRPRFSAALNEWWRGEGNGIAVLEGEEGAGKSWIAAEFANTAPGVSPTVFWLDSLAWSLSSSVQAIVQAGLESLFIPGDRRPARLVQKVFRRWVEPVLVVLDGANEREAWIAAERVIYDYHARGPEMAAKVRLLFTTRPMRHRPRAGRSFWSGAHTIQVGPFDDPEFEAALAKYSPETSPDSVTTAIRDLARIPRYFRLSISLKKRMSFAGHLSREVLLWADLEEKLLNRDPQLLELQEKLQGSPAEILAHLARQLGWPTGASTSVATGELRRILPNIDQARGDLQDNRVVISSNLSETALSADHLVLGWALILQEVALSDMGEDQDALCDRLQRLLEPAAANDNKARAIHLAAVMTFLSEADGAKKARIALLRLWVAHHNSDVNVDSLSFFLSSDRHAYAATVEAFFRAHLPGNFETSLIAPLAQQRENGTSDSGLQVVLERWLRLIYPGGAAGSKGGDVTPPSRFPAAASSEQLRLSYAAISIISFRPDFALLPALADCMASMSYCYAERGGAGRLRLPIKTPIEPLGLLARWGFGAAGLDEVARLADLAAPEGRKQLRNFARLWRSTILPTSLGEAEDIAGDRDPKNDAVIVEDLQRSFGEGGSERPNWLGINVVGRLAIRTDLAPLTSKEVGGLVAEADKTLALIFQNGFAGTYQQEAMEDLLPYLARYAIDEFGRATSALWRYAINAPSAWEQLLRLDDFTPGDHGGPSLAALVAGQINRLVAQPNMAYAATRLTELMLFHADREQLLAWLDAIAHLQAQHSEHSPLISIQSPSIFADLAPDGFFNVAKRRFEDVESDATHFSTETGRRRAVHWLLACAYSSHRHSAENGRWAISLADRYGDLPGFRFPLFLLTLGSNDREVLKRALKHPAFGEFQTGYNAWRWASAFPLEDGVSLKWGELKEFCTLTVGGWLLSAAGADDELKEWGADFGAAAIVALSHVGEPRSKPSLEFRIGAAGELAGISPAPLKGGRESWVGLSSPAWGIDRQSSVAAPTQIDADRSVEALRREMEQRASRESREFSEFNACGPLRRWRIAAPDEFLAWARRFLSLAAEGGEAARIGMGTLLAVVEAEILEMRPEIVFEADRMAGSASQVSVLTAGGTVSIDVKALWNPKLNHSDVARAQRRRALLEAKNDEEILWQILAALVNENEGTTLDFADDWLGSGEATDRALAVDVLAFIGEENHLTKLASMAEEDDSFWVREHATWAVDVCATESACRKRYYGILRATSLDAISAGLAEMSPALSPLSFGWRDTKANQQRLSLMGPRNRAAIQSFWAHRDSKSSARRDVKLAGRSLRDYCRGERLSSGVSDKMAPWWRPASRRGQD